MNTDTERVKIAFDAVRQELSDMILNITLVGSTYISGNEESDVDILVLVEELPDNLSSDWVESGSGSVNMEGSWRSWKKDVDGVAVNALVTDDQKYYKDWVLAAEVCHFVHLMGVKLPRPVVHGIHGIIMDEGNAVLEHFIRKDCIV